MNLDKNASFVILPFENHTETPLAGWRVSGIVEGVFSSKGFNVKEIFHDIPVKDLSSEEIKELIKKAKIKNIKYVITGYVNEWRYKTGIDGEPVVSITLKIIDTEMEKPVWIGVASKTGWGHESVGTVTQKLINKMVTVVNKDK